MAFVFGRGFATRRSAAESPLRVDLEASGLLERALQAAPKDIVGQYYYVFALVYRREPDTEGATRLIDSLLASARGVSLLAGFPGRLPSLYRVKASALLSLRRYQDALRVYADLQDIAPDDPLLYRGVGQCYLVMGRLSEAEKAYAQAIQLDPEDANSITGLATVTS